MKNRSGPERGAWSRRPSFTPRQMLTAEQLNAGLADELMRQQLLSRAVHGYGVVLGRDESLKFSGERRGHILRPIEVQTFQAMMWGKSVPSGTCCWGVTLAERAT